MLDMLAPGRRIEKHRDCTQAEQGQQDSVKVDGHLLKDQHRVSAFDPCITKQRGDLSGIQFEFSKRYRTVASKPCLDDRHSLWSHLNLFGKDFDEIHFYRA